MHAGWHLRFIYNNKVTPLPFCNGQQVCDYHIVYEYLKNIVPRVSVEKECEIEGIHAYIHTYIYIYTHTHTHTCTHTYTHTYILTYLLTYKLSLTYTYIHIDVNTGEIITIDSFQA